MDWYLERAEHVGELRHEIVRHLARHAVRGSEDAVADAELVVSEAVGNAVRHTGGPVWVSLSWTEEQPVLQVFDVGPGFEATAGQDWESALASVSPSPEDESGRGLLIMRMLAPEVVASMREHAGMVVSIRLGVRRQKATSIDPPRRHIGALPRLEEAQDAGAFGKESFLRALVVQLSQTVESHHGPDAAEAVVAQVGTDVGGQMEAEYRLATEVVGRLSPEQLGHCYVRLKHAIDGGFRVVEANPERVVLENTRCPFGDAVKRSPALCRMTSSVFGGIAARNSDRGAAVLLEERIAVGDPGCRVVVYLEEPPADVQPFVHHYRPSTEADPLAGSREPSPDG